MKRTIGLAAALVMYLGGTAGAQQRDALDDRWLPWLGCWTPAASTPDDAAVQLPDGDASARPLLCFLPVAAAGDAGPGVELLTFAGDSLVSTTRLAADGRGRPVEDRGCNGEESAAWSARGQRLFLTAELACAGGMGRRSTGIMAWVGRNQWLDVQVVHVMQAHATRARRYGAAEPPAGVAPRLAGLEARATAIESARIAASGRLSHDEIIEAVHAAGAEATAVLLVERRAAHHVDARSLARLADAGVPGEITDLIIALSHPDRFALERSPLLPAGRGETALAPAEPYADPRGAPLAGTDDDPFVGGHRYPGSATNSFGQCVIVGYDAYGRPLYRDRYGAGSTRARDYDRRRDCAPLGYGDPYGWGHDRYVPVRVRSARAPSQPSGRAEEGRGYTRPESARDRDGSEPDRPVRRAVRKRDSED